MFGSVKSNAEAAARIKHLRVFGCVAYQWLHPAQRKSGKWVACANPGMFLGYGLSKSIYRVYGFVTLGHHECSLVSFCKDVMAWPTFGKKSSFNIKPIFDGYYKLSEDKIKIQEISLDTLASAAVLNSSQTPIRGIELQNTSLRTSHAPSRGRASYLTLLSSKCAVSK